MSNIFDQIIPRRQTGCLKWDETKNLFGGDDVLPLWVADMDFAAPPAVIDALRERLNHGVFGYPTPAAYAYDAVAAWLLHRHQWHTEPQWMLSTPGVVTAMILAVQTFTEPGDKIIIQPPVYPPFFSSVQGQGRTLIENPLLLTDDGYRMDFDDLRQKAKGAKMLIVCSPHNPVGRVWSREELQTLAAICLEEQILVIADEIHGDLIYAGHKHIPLASLGNGLEQQIITLTAPSKTFNTAGLYTSLAIIANDSLRRKYVHTVQSLGVSKSNVFGILALEAAYRHGGSWLNELLLYLEGNADYLTRTVNDKLPGISVTKPQGTYLAWLDCRALGKNEQQLAEFFAREANVGLNGGNSFGAPGNGFMRLNFGCPRSVLAEGLQRIARALISSR